MRNFYRDQEVNFSDIASDGKLFKYYLKQFQNYLSFCYVNMSFTTETEQNNKTSYLDIHIIREQGKLITNVYQKQTFSSVCTHFDSFLPDS